MRRALFILLGKPTNRWQLVLNILSPLLQIGVLVWLACCFRAMPDEIPMHYNGAGIVTEMGGKGNLWVMPIIGVVDDLILWIVTLMPESAINTGVRVTAQNRSFVFGCAHDLIAELRLGMSLLFAVLSGVFICCPERYPIWLPAVLCVLLCVPIVRYFVRIARMKRRGF